MELTLKRRWLTEASTIGEMYVDGVRECFVLEDRYRPPPEPKVPGATCIPVGRYHVEITHSPKFNRDLPEIWNFKTLGGRKMIRVADEFQGLTEFSGVRIHPGNTASDTEGCLLPGRVVHHESVQQSVPAFVELFAKLMGAEEIWLTVTVEPSSEPPKSMLPICL